MARRVTPLRMAIFLSPLTQREIASAVGVSEGHFSLIVSGKRHADQVMREKIAAVLGCEAVDLFGPDRRAA